MADQERPLAESVRGEGADMCERLVAHLKARAESYSRDARNLLEDGDRHAAVAYVQLFVVS